MNLEKKLKQILTAECVKFNIHFAVDIGANTINIALYADLPIGFITKEFQQNLTQQCQNIAQEYVVNLTLQQEILARPTQLPGKGLRGVKNVIAVASGKGGVGKSTVAVNLAVTLAQHGAKVGLLDADIYGPSIPTMLGKSEILQRTDEHYLPIKAHGIVAMSIAYLVQNQSASLIWRGPMLAKSLMHMLDLTKWEDLDYLIIDLPPGTGDIQLSLVQKIPLTGAVIVTTPQQIATLDAEKAIHMFQKTNVKVIGIIENMSLHTCSNCGHQEHVFGEDGARKLAISQHCELLGQLPLNTQIGKYCDLGEPVALQDWNPFVNIAKQVALKI